MYVIAIYWAVQTVTTVGYGDVGSSNSFERIVCAICMVFGVCVFTFANGSLASIMQNYDHQNAEYEEKMRTLNTIYRQYQLPLELFIRIKKSMGLENKKELQEVERLLEDLPYKLRTEVSLYIYE